MKSLCLSAVAFSFFAVSMLMMPTIASSANPVADFACAFSLSPLDCGFEEQSKVPGRARVVPTTRDGSNGVRLHTEPGDNNVYGSGSAERNDLSLSPAATGCSQGVQQWWAHSIYFPSDYVAPPNNGTWNWGEVFAFHHTGSTGQANLQVLSLPTGLAFAVAGGDTVATGPGDPNYHLAPIGPLVKNTWYDFVYFVRWSSGSDGFIHGWVNGALKLDYRGPTLYAGQGCYLKLANYHSPLGVPVSVIHDRVVRGPTALTVSFRPLEGALTLVNGALANVVP